MSKSGESYNKNLLGGIVERELVNAEGGQSDELQANRTTAQRFYDGALPAPPVDEYGDVIEGRSAAVSLDVANNVNAILSQMREMLIDRSELFIEAEGDQDEISAKAESDICTDVLMKDNRGGYLLSEAIKTALLMKNGAVKVGMEDGELRVRGVPIENISFTAGHVGGVQDLPFFAEAVTYTRSDLVEMGLDRGEIDDLPSMAAEQTATELARNASYTQPRDAETRDQDEIDCHIAYVRADLNDDGISERYVCLVANSNTCLEYEEISHIPYALGAAFIAPYRITGESVYDRIGQYQILKTSMLRQWHDNVAIVNNGRYIYSPANDTEEDIMNPVAGGGIRARNPQSSVVPLMIPDVSSGISMALGYYDREITKSMGGALDMISANAQLANKAATTASIEKGNQETVSSMVAANLTKTLLEPIYSLIHNYLRIYGDRSYLARIRGQAVPIDPRTWPPRNRMTVRAGLAPGMQAMSQQALMGHQQLQAQAMSQGLDGILSTAQTLYRTQIRWLKINGVSDPESLVVDPDSMAAQQAQQRKAQQAQQAQAANQQMIKTQVELEMAKIAEDARQADQKTKHDYYETDMKAEIEEAKIAGQGVIDLEKQRMADASGARQAARDNAQVGGVGE